MKLTVKIEGLRELQQTLQGFSDRRMNAAIATALTRTAVEVREEVQRQLPSIFDRPTPYTTNSLFVRPARADKLQAETYFKDESAASRMGTPATKFLMPQVEGGARRVKRFERALQLSGAMPAGWQIVPGAYAKLDAYGNISTGQLIQILSQLRVTLTAGHARNMAFGAKGIAAQRRAGGRYFVVKPGTKGPAPGVYLREFIGGGIMPVLMFVRATEYRKRFDFYGIAQATADQRLGPNIDRAVGEQIARLRGGGMR